MAQQLSGPSNLTGQVALITGGSGGMGRAITKAGAQPAVYGVLSAEIAAGNFSQ